MVKNEVTEVESLPQNGGVLTLTDEELYHHKDRPKSSKRKKEHPHVTFGMNYEETQVEQFVIENENAK